jgi:processive 1,2-diacylglycerol beta-glucosyltransferase
MNKKKIMIFYISKHSGHYHAAMALEQAFSLQSRDVDVVKINAITHTNPILGNIVNRAYLEVINKKPEIWGRIYDNPEFMKKTKRARAALHRFNMSKIRKLIERTSPDIVYCTQAFPCGLVADYKRTLSVSLPLVGILTDHAPHSYWLYDEVDFYVVPSPETGKKLQEKGIPPEKIKAFGIPVAPKFRERHVRDGIIDEFGLKKDMPTVLMMGGSQGLGAMEETVLALGNAPLRKYQIVAVTGSNKRLYRKLKKHVESNGLDHVSILPYVGNIDLLMEVSDVIVSKAGGMTTAEALAKSLPMVIVNPFPGHERMNTDYLVGKGVAVEVTECAHLKDKLNELFDAPAIIEKMRENIRAIARPNSALDAAALAFRG